jgi:hypothetical protein
MMPASETNKYWFALKVFYRRTAALENEFKVAGCETYVPRMVVEVADSGGIQYKTQPAVSSLLFVNCTEPFLQEQKHLHDSDFLCYSDLATKKPGRIPEAEFLNFKNATAILDPEAEYLGSDTEWFKDGEKVMVTEGIHKGRTGWIRRIKGRKRFIVCVEGVSAVAFQMIPSAFLQTLEPSKRKKQNEQ